MMYALYDAAGNRISEPRATRRRNQAALIIWACLALGWIVAGLAVLA